MVRTQENTSDKCRGSVLIRGVFRIDSQALTGLVFLPAFGPRRSASAYLVAGAVGAAVEVPVEPVSMADSFTEVSSEYGDSFQPPST